LPWFARDLEPLSAVVAATLNEDGTLIEANADFLRIIKLEGQTRSARTPRAFFYSRILRPWPMQMRGPTERFTADC
jgi:hypothetical protein